MISTHLAQLGYGAPVQRVQSANDGGMSGGPVDRYVDM